MAGNPPEALKEDLNTVSILIGFVVSTLAIDQLACAELYGGHRPGQRDQRDEVRLWLVHDLSFKHNRIAGAIRGTQQLPAGLFGVPGCQRQPEYFLAFGHGDDTGRVAMEFLHLR